VACSLVIIGPIFLSTESSDSAVRTIGVVVLVVGCVLVLPARWFWLKGSQASSGGTVYAAAPAAAHPQGPVEVVIHDVGRR
jgi:hypothetical protein